MTETEKKVVDTATNTKETALAVIKTQNMTEEFAVTDVGQGAVIRTATNTDDVLLFNAVNGSAEKVVDHLGQDIKVTDIVVTSADILKDINDPDPENGEKENKPVIHFFTADGKHISSISNGIIRATKNLLSCGFIPSVDNPITIKFKEIRTKNGIAHSFDMIAK
jgi:hypothetical protein